MAILLLVALLGSAAEQPALIRMTGVVSDSTGLPLPGVTIEIDGVLRAVSDDRGEFDLDLPAVPRVRLLVALPGFDSRQEVVDVRRDGKLAIVLDVARLADHVTVVAPTAEKTVIPTFSLDPVQIYRTPGGQADVFRALQTLPGVTTPEDGAGLFVRGGDVSEVLVALDDAEIAHPYRYETPTGGFRGAVDPLLITNLAFSSGGFGARYGDVLSAVVDLHGTERPSSLESGATVGLAGASASLAVPTGSRSGLRAAVNRTFTRLLFAVNGAPRYFDPAPEGWDGSLGFAATLGRAGSIKGIALGQRDRVGVEIEQDAFVGLLRSSSTHRFAGGQWEVPLRQWVGTLSVGADSYERATRVGVLDMVTDDQVKSWRAEGRRGTWHIGANGAFARTVTRGVVPMNGGDLTGVSGTSTFDADVNDWFAGAYAETTSTYRALAVTPGVRIDRYGLARSSTVDPRLNIRISAGTDRHVRLATGVYRQAPAASYYDRVRGATRLPPMRAVHYVAGVDRGRESEGLFLRAEGYVKKYSRLPLEHPQQGYTDEGYGWSRGADVFAQWISARFQLRGSGTWLRARRRWTPIDQRQRYDLPDGTWTPDFEIPWSVHVTALVPLSRGFSLGTAWRRAAGRPHTPIVAGRLVAAGVEPLFGPLNSDRLPRYERLDVSLSQLKAVRGLIAVWFVTVDNALGRNNAFDYTYSADYSSRRLVTSASPRSVYIGVTVRR